MAYDRYATQFTDKDGNVYGVMDEEARSHLALVEGGYNPDMVVGGAEHLVSKDGAVDTTPYGLRQVPDGAGQAYLEKVVGGTVAWNQLVQNGNFSENLTRWGYGSNANASVTNGVMTATAKSTPTGNQSVYTTGYTFNIPDSHKVLWLARLASENAQVTVQFVHNSPWTLIASVPVSITSTMKECGGVVANTKGLSYDSLFMNFDNKQNLIASNVMLFDLTQMFGPTIADAIYAMEQATAGAGVAWFRKLFPASYYPYNAGELISVNALSRRTVGFNQWDEEWEVTTRQGMNSIWTKNYIPVLPNTQYCVNMGHSIYTIKINQYDSEKTLIKTQDYGLTNHIRLFTTESNCAFIMVGFNTNYGNTYQNDVCISLSSDRNGEYEPYSAHTYPFADLTLRGIPKLENGELGYDGDTYLPDGTVTRRFGVVDLGTLTWSKDSDTVFYAPVPGALGKFSTNGNTEICSKYASNGSTSTWPDKSCRFGAASTNINVSDSAFSGKTTTEVKSLLSGVYLVYELATPTTEQADPFNPFQILDPYGTEEFISGTIVPVGHTTRYQADMAKTMRKEIDAALICPTASGAIASFPDGADGLKLRELNVAVEPVQDLHGYDAPWPGGGGKNKLKVDATTQTINGVTFTVGSDGTISCSGNASSTAIFYPCNWAGENGTQYILSGCPSGGGLSDKYKLDYNNNGAFQIDSGTGVTFTSAGTEGNVRIVIYAGYGNGLVFKPMIRLASVSDATFAPYSNICPISGHTGAVVTRTGKNLLPMTVSAIKALNTVGTWSGNTYTMNGVSYAIQTDSAENVTGILTNGTASNNSAFILVSQASAGFRDIVQGKSLAITGGISITSKIIAYNFMGNGGQHIDTGSGITVTFANKSANFNASIYVNTGDTVTNVLFKPMIRLASETDGTYEPYQGLSVTIPFGQTVYGGNLTLHQDGSGELVVDHGLFKPTLSTEIVRQPGKTDYYFNIKIPGCDRTQTIVNGIICNILQSGEFEGATGIWYGGADACCIRVGNLSFYTDATKQMAQPDVLNWLVNSNTEIYYPLDTPVTISLSASQITTLLGRNNIFADCGDVSVTYPADTKLYVDGQQTEDDMTANTNIPNSNYFQIGNTLYQATAAIAQGETIIPGTNCTRTTFAEALNLLAAQ